MHRDALASLTSMLRVPDLKCLDTGQKGTLDDKTKPDYMSGESNVDAATDHLDQPET